MARPLVAWTRPARLDLLKAIEYLVREAQAPEAAADLIDRLEKAAASLTHSPEWGRIVGRQIALTSPPEGSSLPPQPRSELRERFAAPKHTAEGDVDTRAFLIRIGDAC